MKKLLFFALVLIFTSSYSQNANFSVNLSYNQPFIGDIEGSYNSILYSSSKIKETYTSKPGGKFSGNIKFEINSRLFIETGLQLNLLRYQRESKAIDSDYPGLEEIILGSDSSLVGGGVIWDEETGAYIPISDSTVWGYPLRNLDYVNKRKTTILYTEIPIQIVYSFFNQKLKCKIGIITSFLTYAKYYNPDIIELLGSSSEDHIDKTGDGFSNVLFSGNIGIEYMIKENIGLNLSYSRSFNSINDEYSSVGKPKYNIFSLGLSYNFLK